MDCLEAMLLYIISLPRSACANCSTVYEYVFICAIFNTIMLLEMSLLLDKLYFH